MFVSLIEIYENEGEKQINPFAKYFLPNNSTFHAFDGFERLNSRILDLLCERSNARCSHAYFEIGGVEEFEHSLGVSTLDFRFGTVSISQLMNKS